MKPAARKALVIMLIKSLQEQGSWCGETHVQKATYCLQNITGVPADFDFILYKHGPFSFDLSDHLALMRADGLLELEYYPYGAKIIVSNKGNSFLEKFPRTAEKFREKINYISETFGSKGVAALERLSTALYVKLTIGDNEAKNRAAFLHELKHHIPITKATEAVDEMDRIISQAI
jgi:uncharacterized protein YwgA